MEALVDQETDLATTVSGVDNGNDGSSCSPTGDHQKAAKRSLCKGDSLIDAKRKRKAASSPYPIGGAGMRDNCYANYCNWLIYWCEHVLFCLPQDTSASTSTNAKARDVAGKPPL